MTMPIPGPFGHDTKDEPVELAIHDLIGSHMAIMANSGSGKSRTVRKVLELAAGQAQRIVLDIEDDFYTLRETAPNMLIAGGDNGDCPAKIANAADLATFLLESGLDGVIQLNDLELEDQQEFISIFLRTMLRAPKSLWHPALVVIDEAHRIAPEGSGVDSLKAVIALMVQGRKRSFTGILASHRNSMVSKDALSGVNNWLLGRAPLDVDRQRVAKTLGFRSTSPEAKGLQTLSPGWFWGFGPALPTIPTLIHVEDVETTHLRPGHRDVPTPPAPAAIQKMLMQLAAKAVEHDAKPTADAVAASSGSSIDVDVMVNDAYREGQTAGFLAGERKGRADILRRMAAVTNMLIEIDRDCTEPVSLIDTDNAEVSRETPPASSKLATPAKAGHHPPTIKLVNPDIIGKLPKLTEADDPSPSLSGPQRLMLQALRWWATMGNMAPTRAQVAAICKWRITSGHLKNVAGSLSSAGLVEYPSAGRLGLTPAGSAIAPMPEDGLSVVAGIKANLNGPQTQMYDLLRSTGKPMTRVAIAERLGWAITSGHLKNVAGSLKTLDLIDYPEQGIVALQRWAQG